MESFSRKRSRSVGFPLNSCRKVEFSQRVVSVVVHGVACVGPLPAFGGMYRSFGVNFVRLKIQKGKKGVARLVCKTRLAL